MSDFKCMKFEFYSEQVSESQTGTNLDALEIAYRPLQNHKMHVMQQIVIDIYENCVVFFCRSENRVVIIMRKCRGLSLF
jgi:hypothetical protein